MEQEELIRSYGFLGVAVRCRQSDWWDQITWKRGKILKGVYPKEARQMRVISVKFNNITLIVLI